MLVLSQARRAQREAGFIQWEDGYPSIETMNTDINSGIGYIIEDNGVLVGYVAIATHDEEYENNPNYGVAMELMPFFIVSQFQTNTGVKGTQKLYLT